nr:MAG TPA: hypothetical protein [Bacteriophage sp.]
MSKNYFNSNANLSMTNYLLIIIKPQLTVKGL